jgi:YfiH family protein
VLDDWMERSEGPVADLGGGFAIARGAIVATALAGTGVKGFASPFDVDARFDADAASWAHALGADAGRRMLSLKQMHGTTVVNAGTQANGQSPEADGAWTSSPSDLLVVRTADCAALWLVDPERERLALLHVGWRGAAAGIIRHAVQTLVEDGSDPGALVAAAGPHIGRCCFEVGLDVAAPFHEIDGAVNAPHILKVRSRADTVSLDLGAIIAGQLHEAGLSRIGVHIATACTRCSDGVLHSYRRNGQGGPLMGSIGFLET